MTKRDTPDRWKIRIAGYGTFDFIGTEKEAEEMRVHKARWEGAMGVKWRTTNQTEVDLLQEQIAGFWDISQGAPMRLCKKLNTAKRAALAAVKEPPR